MSDRFFTNFPIQGNSVTLDGDQAHHIRNVMRMKPGGEVTLFDGSGKEFLATITQVGRRTIDLEVAAGQAVCRELSTKVLIASALPKGDRLKVLIEKLVELGVSTFVPLQTQRSVVVANEKSLRRMKKHVVEAAKQSGRNLLMEIQPSIRISDFLEEVSIEGPKIIADPTGESLAHLDLTSHRCCSFMTGPEGGFTDDEVGNALAHGWTNASLGKTILRIETAAIAVASLAAWCSGRRGPD